MRGLAEFVMTGRKQAILAAGLLALIPLIFSNPLLSLLGLLSPVVVGLVMLTKGLREATFVFIWGALPLVVLAMSIDVVPLILLFGITGLAWLLRETESWEFTFLAAIGIGLVVEVYLRLQPAVIDALFQQFQLLSQQSSFQGMGFDQVTETEIITSIGSVCMFLSIVLTMLARWMQASLFNPGGFRSEIHRLGIKQKIALILLGFMLLCGYGIFIPPDWVIYFMLPLMFSGIGLVHGVVAKRKMSSSVLVVFYVLLVVAMPVVVLLALVDSWYDFRARLDQVG